MLGPEARILVVDDFETVRVMLRSALGELGFALVDEAEDGQRALEMMQAAADEGRPYALVFSDLNMPGVSGLELLQFMRADPALAKTPFVMVTAESERHYVVKSLQSGATDYVVKPFSVASLKKKIEKIGERIKRVA
jgi:two-component system chemotaxis response regulator CheY